RVQTMDLAAETRPYRSLATRTETAPFFRSSSTRMATGSWDGRGASASVNRNSVVAFFSTASDRRRAIFAHGPSEGYRESDRESLGTLDTSTTTTEKIPLSASFHAMRAISEACGRTTSSRSRQIPLARTAGPNSVQSGSIHAHHALVR